MAVNLEAIIHRLEVGARQQNKPEWAEGAARLREIAASGLLPQELPKIKRERRPQNEQSSKLTLDDARALNPVGQWLTDETNLRDLTSWPRMDPSKGSLDYHFYSDPKVTLSRLKRWHEEGLGTLNEHQISRLHSFVINLGRGGLRKVGDIRRSSIDELKAMERVGSKTASFMKTMLEVPEEIYS